MISAVFIDRPRLAFVVSIVITLAGLLAIAAIPVAQFPDIVVASGLKEGENVIVDGVQKVRPGQVVQEAALPAAPQSN